MKDLDQLQIEINTLINTRKYKRKTETIDKQIEELLYQLEGKLAVGKIEKPTLIINNGVWTEILPDEAPEVIENEIEAEPSYKEGDISDSIAYQVGEIKKIVDSQSKKGRPKKKK